MTRAIWIIIIQWAHGASDKKDYTYLQNHGFYPTPECSSCLSPADRWPRFRQQQPGYANVLLDWTCYNTSSKVGAATGPVPASISSSIMSPHAISTCRRSYYLKITESCFMSYIHFYNVLFTLSSGTARTVVFDHFNIV